MTCFQRFSNSLVSSIVTIWLFLLFPCFSSAVASEQDQFEKKEWSEPRITLMAPRGWQTLLEKTDDTSIFHVSPEPIDTAATGYQVGLAINILRSVPSIMGQKPSEYAQSLVDQIRERNEQEPTVRTMQSAGFKIYRVEYTLVAAEGEESLNVVNILEANDFTGTLYMIVWQAPESQTQSFSETREKILASIQLDPTF